MVFSDFDKQMMQRALSLAEKGIFTTYPNPNVGCVIVQGADIVGEGSHLRAGEPHAEIHALCKAGDKAEEATAYVTLEPCSHFGRTGPCAEALIHAKVKRVVCAMIDPNPAVSGQGVEKLKRAGIEVQVGLCQGEAEQLNKSFICRMQHQRPFIQLKMASSIDGRTALMNGKSQWITGKASRQDVQACRAKAGAILSTAKTVNEDNASLTVRWAELPPAVQAIYPEEDLRQPLRIILDTHGTLNPDANVFRSPSDIWVLTHRTDLTFPYPHVQVFTLPPTPSHIAGKNPLGLNLKGVMAFLFSKAVYHIWIEAGATLAKSVLLDGLFDEFILYQAPSLMGADSRALVELTGLTDMAALPSFQFTDLCLIGEDVRLTLSKR